MAEESIENLPQYEYQPLPDNSHIRLLRRVAQGNAGSSSVADDGILRFTLEARGLDAASLRYHCLSYTWGNPFSHGIGFRAYFDAVADDYEPGRTVPIIVDGCVVHVQRNLRDALAVVGEENAYRKHLEMPTRVRGRTSMHRAAELGRSSYVRLWVRRGVNVSPVDEDGRLPMHDAARNGHAGVVELLCEAGSRRVVKDNEGNTPEDLAEAAGHEDVVQVLRAWASRPDPEVSSIQLEEDGPEGLVWADAVCINQADTAEKSAQVSMMDRIYSHSSYVVAWLGPEDQHTEAGLRAVGTLRRHLDVLRESNVVPFDGTDPENYEAVGVPHIPREEWRGLASIYQRQWFRRSWIVQEAILPDLLAMYCGAHQLSYHDLGTIAMMLRSLHGRHNRGLTMTYVPTDEIAVSVEWNMTELFKLRESLYFTRTADDPEEREARGDSFQLSRLARSFETFLVSDPRDKIFSLYGLINSKTEEAPAAAAGSGRMVADYGQSTVIVYTIATWRILRESGDLRIICAWTDMERRRPGLPSWVPDYQLITGNEIPDFDADRGLEYEGPQLGNEPESPYLGLRGLRVGRISRVGGRVSTAPGGKFRFDPSWLSMALSLRGAASPKGEDATGHDCAGCDASTAKEGPKDDVNAEADGASKTDDTNAHEAPEREEAAEAYGATGSGGDDTDGNKTAKVDETIKKNEAIQKGAVDQDSSGGKPKVNLSEILWRTLCMDSSPSWLQDRSHPEDRAPDEFGLQFYIFMQLMIFAGADEKLLQAVGLEASLERDMFTIIHIDHNPLEDMADTLDDLDALHAHDGPSCFVPPRSSIEEYYGHLKHTLVRNSPGRDDKPLDFNVPPSVIEGKDRLVGRGIVKSNSRFFQKCHDFSVAYFWTVGYRQLVIMDGERLGVAGLLAKAGDEIWIIPGIKAPVVLRRIETEDSSTSRYQFLGKAYIYGIMHGEASVGREDELEDIELA